jgi:hypothetical protein
MAKTRAKIKQLLTRLDHVARVVRQALDASELPA